MVSVSQRAISRICYQIASLLYVDDTNLLIYNQGNELETNIVARAQATLDIWHQGLKYTGGDLKIMKCL